MIEQMINEQMIEQLTRCPVPSDSSELESQKYNVYIAVYTPAKVRLTRLTTAVEEMCERLPDHPVTDQLITTEQELSDAITTCERWLDGYEPPAPHVKSLTCKPHRSRKRASAPAKTTTNARIAAMRRRLKM